MLKFVNYVKKCKPKWQTKPVTLSFQFTFKLPKVQFHSNQIQAHFYELRWF